MYYIDALNLLNLCVEHKILHEDESCIAVYKNSTNTSKEGWYLIPKDVLAQNLMADKEGQIKLIKALSKANINFKPTYSKDEDISSIESIETYISIWYEEEEEWYYFKNSFDESLFPHGYVDYEVGVKNGIILYDTYNRDNENKPFEEVYDKSLWENK